jgi:hypothetical protein
MYEDDLNFRPGAVVLARVLNALESRTSRGKVRPVVLVFEENGHWRVAGLTTNPRRRDGSPRLGLSDWKAVGLRGPGYLWGDRLHAVSKLDLDRVVGHADEALVRAIGTSHRMMPEALKALADSVGLSPADLNTGSAA